MKEASDFENYVRARMPTLRRTAFLLTGDWHRAEDVVQVALVRLYTHWPRVVRLDHPDAYVRRIVVRCWLDDRRRGWFRERVVDAVPERALPTWAGDDRLGVREELLRVLARMPPRQRACVVLRFWEDLSIEQTAALLGCTASTVKSQTSRGLGTLRALLQSPVPNSSVEGR